MNRAHKSINHLLVRLFNDILAIEERALSAGAFSDASVREMHVLEAAGAEREGNSMSAIATRLGITVGSLTVAVTTLERKGYLRRERSTDDKRVVRVLLTERGRQANERHAAFHAEMVEQVQEELTGEQLEVLAGALERIIAFFEHYDVERPSQR
ncbi:MAG: MarR family transcriptional regulator [Clostridia bacterium]|nr:MarR family transcriptional regulator [Clostridia bacterium]